MRRHHQFARLAQPQPPAHVLKAALHGERGRGQHHRWNLIEDQLGSSSETSMGVACKNVVRALATACRGSAYRRGRPADMRRSIQ